MLDIRFIRENRDLVQRKSKEKGYDISIEGFIDALDRRQPLLEKRDHLRNERNTNSFIEITGDVTNTKLSPEQVAKGKEIKAELKEVEEELAKIQEAIDTTYKLIPNIFPDDTPLGGEENNQEIKKWGDTSDKGFAVKDHLSWCETRGLVDFERGAKVAGNKFYYLKAGLVEMQLALAQYSLALVKQKNFWPMGVPHMVNTRVLEGAGFSAKGSEKQIYKVEGEDLNLIATAEIPLTGFFADEIIPNDWLPSRMAGWSPAYRLEAGAYGKHGRGLFRVHQFQKMEMYVYCKPEESEKLHQELLAIEEEICRQLNIPYRVVRIAAGDLGAPAYKKFDIEYWSPVDKAYRELMSCSNVTDYQARRLNIRCKNEKGETQFVHTLNATAAADTRMMIAIIENFQDKDGHVSIPEPLQKYMAGQTQL